jgi:hypothetical protein
MFQGFILWLLGIPLGVSCFFGYLVFSDSLI